MNRTKAKVFILFFIGFFIFVVSSFSATKVTEKDLTDLNLEELMEIEIFSFSTTVLGTHIHDKGEWMLGYKFMYMDMDGNRDGTSRRGRREVLADFPVTPTDMDMYMQMLEIMYGVTDELTLMLMLQTIEVKMNHVTRTGRRFKTKAEGFGDMILAANYTFYKKENETLHLIANLGMSFPTGSIDEEDASPGGRARLPYPMQLGSGTFDLRPGLTYLGYSEDWAWGANTLVIARLGENSNDYTLGDQVHLTSWLTYKLADWWSSTVRLEWQFWGNVDGADPRLNPRLVPTADPNRRGGDRIDLLFGMDLYVPKGRFEGNRALVEVGFPVYQNLEGPQLEQDWRITAGWTLTW